MLDAVILLRGEDGYLPTGEELKEAGFAISTAVAAGNNASQMSDDKREHGAEAIWRTDQDDSPTSKRPPA